MLLAIVGKRNAGKSTLVNALAGEERMIVSELEGTTRDSVDVRFECGGRVFTAIDTAGVRKGKSVKGDVEYYSQHRALRSVRRADVVLFLLDATVPLSQVDEHLAHEIALHYKPCLIVVNKWDLAREALLKEWTTQEKYMDYLTKALAGLNYVPVAFVSAKHDKSVRDLIATAMSLYEQSGTRLPTAQLNDVVQTVMAQKPPTSSIGRRPRIYYMTQTKVHPPTIALFVNDPSMFDAGYQRYLINRVREILPFAEVPIRLLIRGKQRDEDTKVRKHPAQ
jgi:GTP-binding protein